MLIHFNAIIRACFELANRPTSIYAFCTFSKVLYSNMVVTAISVNVEHTLGLVYYFGFLLIVRNFFCLHNLLFLMCRCELALGLYVVHLNYTISVQQCSCNNKSICCVKVFQIL